MKKIVSLALFSLALTVVQANGTIPEPVSVVNLQGEQIPVYAPPHSISPKRSVPPIYPENEINEKVEGKALLTILVGIDGKVVEVDIVSSEPKASFGIAARTAALQWRYEPLRRNGKVTKFIVQQPLVFNYSQD